MLAQEGRDFEMLFGRLRRRRAAVLVELSMGPVAGVRSCGNPSRSGLYGASRRGVAGGRIVGFVGAGIMVRLERESDIGGQALEQRAGISGLGFLSFLRRL